MGAVRGIDPGQRRGGPLSLWAGGQAEVHRQVEAARAGRGRLVCMQTREGRKK